MIRDTLKQVIDANGRGMLKSAFLYPYFADRDRNSELPQNRAVFRMLCRNGDVERIDRFRKKDRAFAARLITDSYSAKYGFSPADVMTVLGDVCTAIGRPLPRQSARRLTAKDVVASVMAGVSRATGKLRVWAVALPAAAVIALALCLLPRSLESEATVEEATPAAVESDISGAYTVLWDDGTLTTAGIERAGDGGAYLLTLYSDSRPVSVPLSLDGDEVLSETMGRGTVVIDRGANTVTITLTDENKTWELTRYL